MFIQWLVKTFVSTTKKQKALENKPKLQRRLRKVVVINDFNIDQTPKQIGINNIIEQLKSAKTLQKLVILIFEISKIIRFASLYLMIKLSPTQYTASNKKML